MFLDRSCRPEGLLHLVVNHAGGSGICANGKPVDDCAANFLVDDNLEGMKMNLKRVVPAVALLAMLVLAAIAASPEAKGDSDRDAAIAEKWVAAWNSHSPDKMLPIYTDDIFYEDVAFGEVSHGSAELRKFAASEFEGVPDLEIKLQRAYVHGGHGTIEWIFSGTDKGVFKTGKKFSVRGVSVIDVRDGKISRSLDFYDVATMMRQVGLLPAPTSDAE